MREILRQLSVTTSTVRTDRSLATLCSWLSILSPSLGSRIRKGIGKKLQRQPECYLCLGIVETWRLRISTHLSLLTLETGWRQNIIVIKTSHSERVRMEVLIPPSPPTGSRGLWWETGRTPRKRAFGCIWLPSWSPSSSNLAQLSPIYIVFCWILSFFVVVILFSRRTEQECLLHKQLHGNKKCNFQSQNCNDYVNDLIIFALKWQNPIIFHLSTLLPAPDSESKREDNFTVSTEIMKTDDSI